MFCVFLVAGGMVPVRSGFGIASASVLSVGALGVKRRRGTAGRSLRVVASVGRCRPGQRRCSARC